MRVIFIASLIVLTALLPLAALPLVIVPVVAALLLVVARVTPVASTGAQPVALLALTRFRAPPSR